MLTTSCLLAASFASLLLEQKQKKAFLIPNNKTSSKQQHIPFRNDDLLIRAAQLSALKTQNIWVLKVVLATIK